MRSGGTEGKGEREREGQGERDGWNGRRRTVVFAYEQRWTQKPRGFRFLLSSPLLIPLLRACVCVFVCVCLLCFFQFSHFVGEERKEERKEGQRDKSDPSNGGRKEGEGVRDMNYYRALVHGKGADRRTVTLFVKYNFERFGRQQFFPSSSPLFPLFFSKGRDDQRLRFASLREGRFLFLSIVIRILYNNYYKVK